MSKKNKKSKLTCKWTVESSQDLQNNFSKDLLEEMTKLLQEEIIKEKRKIRKAKLGKLLGKNDSED